MVDCIKKHVIKHFQFPKKYLFGYWKNLFDVLAGSYLKKSYFLGGSKTGIVRRLSWDEPSLTLTTYPIEKQTERCHPFETRLSLQPLLQLNRH